MRCLQCGNRLALFRKLTDGAFCSDAHRKLYQQQQNQLALARLIESQGKIDKARKEQQESAEAPAAAKETASFLVEQPRECHPPARLLSAPVPAPQIPPTAMPGFSQACVSTKSDRLGASLAGPAILGMHVCAPETSAGANPGRGADTLFAPEVRLGALPGALNGEWCAGLPLRQPVPVPGILQAPALALLQAPDVAPAIPDPEPLAPRLAQSVAAAVRTSRLLVFELAALVAEGNGHAASLASLDPLELAGAPALPATHLRTLTPEFSNPDLTPKTLAGLVPLHVPPAFGKGDIQLAPRNIDSAELSFPAEPGLLPASGDAALTAARTPRPAARVATPIVAAGVLAAPSAVLEPLEVAPAAPALPALGRLPVPLEGVPAMALQVAPPPPAPREQAPAERAMAAVAALGVEAADLPLMTPVGSGIARGELRQLASRVSVPLGPEPALAATAPGCEASAVDVGETGILIPSASAILQPPKAEAPAATADQLARLDWAYAVAPRGTQRTVIDSAQPLAPEPVTERPVSALAPKAGPRSGVKMVPLRQTIKAVTLRDTAGQAAEWLWHTSPALLPVSRFEPVSDSQADAESRSLLGAAHLRTVFKPVVHFWNHAPADLRWMAMVIPLVLALAYYSVTPTGKVFAKQSERGSGIGTILSVHWNNLNRQLKSRAAVELRDDFRSGLAQWEGEGDWSKGWAYDAAGFVRTGSLALYQPSLRLSDYRMEFLGQIEKKSLGWVYRAADSRNYYATKLVILRSGPLPTVGIVRYAVIDGKEGPHVQLPVPISVRADTLYRVRVDVRGSDFVTSVLGQVIDVWSDKRLRSGGVGFFSERGEEGKLRWVEISHQYDVLGRLCAFLAPYSIPNTNGRSSQ